LLYTLTGKTNTFVQLIDRNNELVKRHRKTDELDSKVSN